MREDRNGKRRNRHDEHSQRLTIGVLMPSMQYGMCRDLWKGFHAIAEEYDVNLLLFVGDEVGCGPADFREQANIAYEFANSTTIDGVLIWGGPLLRLLDTEQIQQFCARYAPLPMVCMSLALPGIPGIVAGNAQGMRDMLAHLIEVHGCRRIAFLRGPTEDNTEANERYQAYCDVLKEYGLPYNPDLVLLGNHLGSVAGTAMRELLERGLRPPKDFDALAASEDTMLVGVLKVFQEYGIRVPQDVAMAGFVDIDAARATDPPLSTVRYDFERLGRQAITLLLSKLFNSSSSSPVVHDDTQPCVMPLQMVIRQSCGCFAESIAQAAAFEDVVSSDLQKDSSSDRCWGEQESVVPAAIASKERLANAAEMLAGACHDALQNEGTNRVFETLQSAISDTLAEGVDVELWQDVVSGLRARWLSALPEKTAGSVQAEDLFHQARVLIGQSARRVQEAGRIRLGEQEQRLRAIWAKLLTTIDIDALMKILVDDLPGAGIPSCYVTMYDAPHPYGYSRSIAHWQASVLLAYRSSLSGRLEELPRSNEQVFSAPQLLPKELLPADRRYDMVVMPLYFRERQIGVAIFEGLPREGIFYHALRTEISSALHEAFLIDQIQQNALEITRQKSILDTFMASVPDTIYFKDREGRVTQANQAYAAHVGCATPDDVLGKSDFDFYPEEIARRRWEQEQAILRSDKPLLELEETDPQGRWVLTTKIPLRDGLGKLMGTFGISRDITTLKQTEQELRRYQEHLEELVKERTHELTQTNTLLEQENFERRRAEDARRIREEQYRMLAEHVKDGIAIVQQDRIVFANTALAEMLAHPKSRLLELNPEQFFPDQTLPVPYAEELKKNPEAWQVELTGCGGHSIWVEIEPDAIAWNTESALLLTIRNVTQARLREMRLEEERTRLQQENLTLKSAGTERYRFGALIGKSSPMQQVYELIVSAAMSGVNVLISGESGTGKELIARTIHQVSPRKDRNFVPINCASIPETLFEREFFGHLRGAFTGADRDKPGLFDRAHQGILFLDEVTELSPGMQAKLLRVLHDGEYLPIGSNRLKKADAVIVAATNKDCREEIAAGRLRQDFFYRIGVIEIQSRPLRDRKDDLPFLIEHFLEQFEQKYHSPGGRLPLHISELPGQLTQALFAYHWPGNVRELQNILQRFLATQRMGDILALLEGQGRVRSLPEISEPAGEAFAPTTLEEAVSEVETRLILETLRQTDHNKSETARRLKIARRTLLLKMQKYHLER